MFLFFWSGGYFGNWISAVCFFVFFYIHLSMLWLFSYENQTLILYCFTPVLANQCAGRHSDLLCSVNHLCFLKNNSTSPPSGFPLLRRPNIPSVFRFDLYKSIVIWYTVSHWKLALRTISIHTIDHNIFLSCNPFNMERSHLEEKQRLQP